MSGVQHCPVQDDEDEMRLDRWFRSRFPGVKQGQLEKMLRKGQIRVDGARAKSSQRVNSGQTIRVPPLQVPGAADPAAMNTSDQAQRGRHRDPERDRAFILNHLLYEDDAIMAINKPHGIAVQGGTNTTRHIDGMLSSFGRGGARPKLVHRLDRDTSGVLVLAKTRQAAAQLGEQFQRHEIEKTYWSLTVGVPTPREGTINKPIAKKPERVPVASPAEGGDIGGEGYERMRPVDNEEGAAVGKHAITDFQTIDEAAGQVGFLALRPRTGRTHQLRVHCELIGVPIVGDGKYGGASAQVEGLSRKLHLCCREMRFRHPTSRHREIVISAPLQGHMLKSWQFFGFDREATVIWPEFLG